MHKPNTNIPIENTPREGVNRCMANLMTNDAELKTKCNTLCVTKDVAEFAIKGSGLTLLNFSKLELRCYLKLSWFNTSMDTHKQYQTYMHDMNNMKQCKV